MNILICSVGRRVQLLDNFKKELNKIGGQVIAIDCDPTAPALYHADHFEIVPRIDHPNYMGVIRELCTQYKVKGILSLIDPELTILASNKESFKQEGIHMIVSDKYVIDVCYDKYITAEFLRMHGLPIVPTYKEMDRIVQHINSGKLTFPLIVKPRKGSASIGVQKIANMNDLQTVMAENPEYIVQPLMAGNEYCVECFIDLLTGENVNLFSKRKFNMRAGETDKSIVIKDAELNRIVDKLIQVLRPVGPIDIDFFKTGEGYVISEINPRFGGGYPYAYEMGHNFIINIINNLQGISNLPYVKYTGDYEEGKTMVRYDHFVVL